MILRLTFSVCLLAGFAAAALAAEPGLVAHYTFEEAAGTVLKDHSGNGNDGTIHNADWVASGQGHALKFKSTAQLRGLRVEACPKARGRHDDLGLGEAQPGLLSRIEAPTGRCWTARFIRCRVSWCGSTGRRPNWCIGRVPPASRRMSAAKRTLAAARTIISRLRAKAIA